jgi:hypothetical protein
VPDRRDLARIPSLGSEVPRLCGTGV